MGPPTGIIVPNILFSITSNTFLVVVVSEHPNSLLSSRVCSRFLIVDLLYN